ncbi:MAG: hypothetical protein KKD18_04365 [Nanoarchaeota archaeon]|nr:hypothetical protein [Nanoarchaeota archaeon]MBU0977625.1 hypothetical protein [Nanoarchaeota archaeon]
MTLRTLIEQGIVFPAMLPEANDFLLSEAGKRKRKELLSQKNGVEGFHRQPPETKKGLLDLDSLDTLVGYTVPLIAHDYSAKTPIMWNSLYNQKQMPLQNIMVVGDPKQAKQILQELKGDPKYLGGGAGVGFKEAAIPYLDLISPSDLKAVNIIVKENGQLVGHNTDSEGLMRSLEEKLEMVDKKTEGETFVLIGAGGVAQQFARTLAEREAGYIVIVNRTFSKAVALADQLNRQYGRDLAIGVGENMTRGVLLNSERPPAAIINLSDKGSDAYPKTTMFYSAGEPNEHVSREMVTQAKKLRPDLIYADIVLPKSGRPISLRVVDAAGINPEYTLDGKPMVIYQAVPAYKMIEIAHPELHKETTEEEVLEIFRRTAA